MAKKTAGVPRPANGTDYVPRFITREAEKGRQDAKATAGNLLAKAWDCLTAHPDREQPALCYILRGSLATLTYQDQDHPRHQYKFTHAGRIWYAVAPVTFLIGPGWARFGVAGLSAPA